MPARAKSPAKATAPPIAVESMVLASAPGGSMAARTVALVLAPALAATAVATEDGATALTAGVPVGRSKVDAASASSVIFASKLVSFLTTGASFTSFSRAATLISTSFFAATGALASSSILATNLESSIGAFATGLAGLFSIATFISTSLGAGGAGGALLKSSSLATVRVFEVDVAEEAGFSTTAAAGAASLMASSSATAIRLPDTSAVVVAAAKRKRASRRFSCWLLLSLSLLDTAWRATTLDC
mmetsp:Transcript_9045/g.12990  ORF Transcript_9045/g.12990 Transcript_9045/m.12990 type:complete len:245 (-) Transcript_9045:187-921(-)